jgi:hypothetical protein
MRPRSALAAVRILALVVALVAVPGASRAGKSHLLQKPESFVLLTTIGAAGVDQCDGNWANKVFAEVRPDGTVSSTEFVVPADSVLVVTDVDWIVAETPANYVVGQVATFWLTLGSGGVGTPVFQTASPIDASIEGAGIFAGSASLTTGFRVGPGVPICPKGLALTGNGGSSNTVSSVTLRGYLIKSK